MMDLIFKYMHQVKHISHGAPSYGADNASNNFRILAWMLYLNDVTDKIGTKPHQNITLKGKEGRLLWMMASIMDTFAHGNTSPSQC